MPDNQVVQQASETSVAPPTENESKWAFVNVHDWQLKGQRINQRTGEMVSATLHNPDCQPFVNKENESKFYRLEMPKGSVFERDGETFDISGYQTTINASFVHKSKYKNKYGLAYSKDYAITFTKDARQADDTYEKVGEVKLVASELNQAQKSADRAYAQSQKQVYDKLPNFKAPTATKAKREEKSFNQSVETAKRSAQAQAKNKVAPSRSPEH